MKKINVNGNPFDSYVLRDLRLPYSNKIKAFRVNRVLSTPERLLELRKGFRANESISLEPTPQVQDLLGNGKISGHMVVCTNPDDEELTVEFMEKEAFDSIYEREVKADTNNKNGLKLYKSHKQVQAMEVEAIYKPGSYLMIHEVDGTKLDAWMLEGEGGHCVFVDQKYIDKHNPRAGGYYVLYPNGYESFSPPDVFEEGYNEIKTFTVDSAVAPRSKADEPESHHADAAAYALGATPWRKMTPAGSVDMEIGVLNDWVDSLLEDKPALTNPYYQALVDSIHEAIDNARRNAVDSVANLHNVIKSED